MYWVSILSLGGDFLKLVAFNISYQIWINSGVPVVAQQKHTQLVSMRMRVGSLTLLSGLRIQCCHELWCRSQTRLRSGIAVAVCKPAAVAPIRPLACRLPYVTGVALESKNVFKKLEKNSKVLIAIKFRIKEHQLPHTLHI